MTPEERRNLRQVLRNLRLHFGTWSCLAAALEVPHTSLRAVAASKHRGSYGLAVRAARVAGSTVEAVLTGKLTPAGACPACGGATGAERRPA